MPARHVTRLATLLLALWLAPGAPAQALDGAWFKVTVAAKGFATVPGLAQKIKGKVVCYMEVSTSDEEGVDPGTLYDFILWCETADDVWAPYSFGSFFAVNESEEIMVGPEADAPPTINHGVRLDIGLPSEVEGGGAPERLLVDMVAQLNVKRDAEGALKSANFKSLGATLPEGLSEGFTIYGGAKVKGKTIDPSKLPFAPTR